MKVLSHFSLGDWQVNKYKYKYVMTTPLKELFSVMVKSPSKRSHHMHELSTSHRLSIFPQTISQWNSLPNHLFYHCNSIEQFRTRVSVLNHMPVNLI